MEREFRGSESILVIDDDEALRQFLVALLLDEGFVAWDVPSPTDAFRLLQNEDVDLIVSDLDMPFTSDETRDLYEQSFRVGVGTIRELIGVFPQTPIVAMSALPQLVLQEIQRELGTVPLLPKPFHHQDFLKVIRRELTNPRPGEVQ